MSCPKGNPHTHPIHMLGERCRVENCANRVFAGNDTCRHCAEEIAALAENAERKRGRAEARALKSANKGLK